MIQNKHQVSDINEMLHYFLEALERSGMEEVSTISGYLRNDLIIDPNKVDKSAMLIASLVREHNLAKIIPDGPYKNVYLMNAKTIQINKEGGWLKYLENQEKSEREEQERKDVREGKEMQQINLEIEHLNNTLKDYKGNRRKTNTALILSIIATLSAVIPLIMSLLEYIYES